MVIQCENCNRKYRLDDSRIKAPGSSVRCSKCGHIFFVSKKEELERRDELMISEETPLFEDLKEEIITEDTNTEHHIDQETILDTSADLTQGELQIKEDRVETGDDMLDLPTEHEENLEEFIDKATPEDTKSDIQSEELQTPAKKSSPDKIEIETEENDIETRSPSELLESKEEVYTDPDIEEDVTIAESKEPDIVEENNQKTPDISSSVKLPKSNSGIFARIIYTLITIAAVFVIFIASLVILINAGILPKGTLSGLITVVESISPVEFSSTEAPKILITEHKARWMNTINGPIYIVSGLITNESVVPVHYVRLRSEYIAADKKQFEDIFYAGNTFTDKELKGTPIKNILLKLDQRNGDIDVNNSRKLAGLNYNIKPGESIPFFSVFPAEGRVLGLKYNLEVVDYKEASPN